MALSPLRLECSFGLIWAVSVVAWAHLGVSGALIGEPGGRPSQRSRGPEADVAMAREAAVVLRRVMLWPKPEAWWDP